MSNRKKRRANRKQIAIFIVIVVALAVAIPRIRKWNRERGLLRAYFVTDNGKTSTFKLEVVNSPEGRKKGLMFRKEMDPDRGMLFVFPEEKIQRFYMKNTFIPLDMIFISQNREIVGILRDVPILNEEIRSVSAPSMYVIELNGGAAAKAGIRRGDKVVFEGEVPAGY